MRKLNAVITAAIMVLFLLHGIIGSFGMMGLSPAVFKTFAWIMTGLIGVHAVIGIKLTTDTLKIQKKTGASYFKENKLFWARRLSGFAIMLFMFFHITAFGFTQNGVYRLRHFDMIRLMTQIMLVVSIAVHVISNVKPMMIALGIKSFRQYAPDIIIVLSILLLIMAAAFFVYYIRWNVM